MNISSTPIHVFLFSFVPLFLIVVDNTHEIPPEDVFLPALISLGITSIVWAILRKFLGGKKSGVIVSIFLGLWIGISQIRLSVSGLENGMEFFGTNLFLIPIFFLIGVILIIIIIKKTISKEIISVINVVSIVIFSFLVFEIVSYDIENSFTIESIDRYVEIPITQNEVVGKPDVYFLILDAYSGDIVLEEDYDFDNSKFNNALRDRGFFVQNPSYSNYPNTEFAMPSILNMIYLDFLVDELGEDSQNKRIAIELRKQNKVMEIFKENDYKVVSFSGGLNVNMPTADEQLCGAIININSELYESFVYMYVPISYLRTQFFENYHTNALECLFSTVKNYQNNDERSSFIFAHISLPHSPFIYDANGNRVPDTFTEDRFDESLRDAYLEQLIFTNKITIEMIDSIQQRDDSAVIIVMSDHGGRLGVDWDNPTEMDYYRTFNTISAFYFPDYEGDIPEKIAVVNTFRVFFNTYLDTDYEILEDKQIWYTPERPYDQTDVTEKLLRN